MTHDEMIAVIQAHKNGKEIEWRMLRIDKDWFGMPPDATFAWDFSNYEYRIKSKNKMLYAYIAKRSHQLHWFEEPIVDCSERWYRVPKLDQVVEE